MSSTGIYLPRRIIKSIRPNRAIAPPRELIDWGIMFNLFVFVTFFGSIFYICLHRYNNKEFYKKQKEAKQRKMVEEFQQALQEYQLNQQKEHYMREMQKKVQNQVQMSRSLDSLRGKLDLLQQPMSNKQLLTKDHQSFSIRPHTYDSQYQTPFFNSSSLINYR